MVGENYKGKYDRTLLIGLNEIAEYLQVSPQTVRRWHRLHGFPMCKKPDGEHISSTALVDDWIQARGIVQSHDRESRHA